MVDWYNKRFANFSGRSTRSEYRYYVLFNVFFVLVIYSIYKITENQLASLFNLHIYVLVMFVPIQAVTIRRLHDLGMKWHYFLLIFLPFFNVLLMVYLLMADGKRGANQYGHDPRET